MKVGIVVDVVECCFNEEFVEEKIEDQEWWLLILLELEVVVMARKRRNVVLHIYSHHPLRPSGAIPRYEISCNDVAIDNVQSLRSSH